MGSFVPLDITSSGTWLNLATVLSILCAAYLAVMWVALVAWTLRDVQSRTTDGGTQVASVLVVAAFFVPGLLLYLVLRPQETMAETGERQIEARAFLQEVQRQPACLECRRAVTDDYLACPFCAARLRAPCDQCERPLLRSWIICPYCSAERRSDSPMPRPATRVASRVASPAADGRRPVVQPWTAR